MSGHAPSSATGSWWPSDARCAADCHRVKFDTHELRAIIFCSLIPFFTRILPLVFLGAGLLLSGCDSNDDGDFEEESFSCVDLGYARGTASATTPDGAFEASCSQVVVSGTQVEVSVLQRPGSGDGNGVELTIRNFTDGATGIVAGTYIIDPSNTSNDLDGRARFYRGSSTIVAETGRIVVTTVTSSRVAGTFEFSSPNGARYTNGRFDVPL